ncbi:MAG: M15 family metallopeptidase [Rikenellaceae bacterium]|nr:M15 family metallopeptidase [Rikenellaceae bacterium]
MTTLRNTLTLLLLFFAPRLMAQPEEVQRLMAAYEVIVDFRNNHLIFADGSTLQYDDGTKKSPAEALDRADVEDMFSEPYNRMMPPTNDAGRIRSDALFRKLYGNSAAEVESHLEWVDWCPRLVGQRLWITGLYGAAEALRRVSEELDRHPEWAPYLKDASTLNWRKIAGTDRLSAHSFGIAIDISVAQSDYWRWSKSGDYRNRIPEQLVAVFEQNGFIWGGRWMHFDTMHFEYRPELLP